MNEFDDWLIDARNGFIILNACFIFIFFLVALVL